MDSGTRRSIMPSAARTLQCAPGSADVGREPSVDGDLEESDLLADGGEDGDSFLDLRRGVRGRTAGAQQTLVFRTAWGHDEVHVHASIQEALPELQRHGFSPRVDRDQGRLERTDVESGT